MKFFRIIALVLYSIMLIGSFSSPVFAAPSTVLPDTTKTATDCQKIMYWVNAHTTNISITQSTGNGEEGTGVKKSIKDVIAKRENVNMKEGIGLVTYTEVLACAIMTGDVKVWMIPYFIRYVLEFIIGIAGLIAVGGIIYGGYLYLFAGLTSDKEKGKTAIKNALLGLVLVLTAWAIVNIVIALVTF